MTLFLINTLAAAVFAVLFYRAICLIVATRRRSLLLRGLQHQFVDEADSLAMYLDRMRREASRGTRVVDVVSEIRNLCDRSRFAERAGIPPNYRPGHALRQIVIAHLTGNTDRSRDEYRHWLGRLNFASWNHRPLARQATNFGLLFTVVGLSVAFANLEESAKPFAIFAALSLAMLSTIAGLLVSLVVLYCLQKFDAVHQQLQIETHAALLGVLQQASQLTAQTDPALPDAKKKPAVQHVRRTTASVKPQPPATNGNGPTEPPIHHSASSKPGGNGGVRCFD